MAFQKLIPPSRKASSPFSQASLGFDKATRSRRLRFNTAGVEFIRNKGYQFHSGTRIEIRIDIESKRLAILINENGDFRVTRLCKKSPDLLNCRVPDLPDLELYYRYEIHAADLDEEMDFLLIPTHAGSSCNDVRPIK